MIEGGLILIVLAILFGVYMTWGIGANDVANAMGTSVGSGAITVTTAIVIAGVFEFCGAVLAGGHVTSTIRKGIIDPAGVPSAEVLAVGMLAALLAAGIWLMVASLYGWPVSTTHSIIGALIGFGLVGIGTEAVDWPQVGSIVASWVISPLIGGVLAFLLAVSVRRLVLDADDPQAAAVRYGPIYVFLMGVLVTLVTVFKGLSHLDIELSTAQTGLLAVSMGVLIALVGRYLIGGITVEPEVEREFHYAGVERVFAPLCVFTACAMAFAHGSNDVANGIGPLAAVVSIASTGQVAQDSPLPLWMLLLGGGGIVVGLATLGYRVMQTIGKRITELTPSRGFCAEMAAAATVVVASRLGLPVSTTHIIVGAVMGVGMARGIAAIDLRVIGAIVASWLVTLPVGAALAALIYYALRALVV